MKDMYSTHENIITTEIARCAAVVMMSSRYGSAASPELPDPVPGV